MPFEARKFIFTVSLCAMLAVNPVLATAPGENESVGSAHEVYVESNLNKATNGIAGVGYVNRMIDAAGNAAQQAENHAAAAGAHALSAAQSATEAHEVLADKVNIDQGADDKNKAMVTDADGTVYPGYVSADMIKGDPSYTGYLEGAALVTRDGRASWGQVESAGIADGAVSEDKIAPGAGGQILVSFSGNDEAGVEWGRVGRDGIANGAVTTEKIADEAVSTDKISGLAVSTDKISGLAVTWEKIADKAVTAEKIYSSGGDAGVALLADGNGGAKWEQVGTAGIADNSVTAKKMDSSGQAAGVVLMADGRTYAEWGQVGSAGIANGAVSTDKISGYAVTTDKIADGAVTTKKIYSSYSGKSVVEDAPIGYVLQADGKGGATWGQLESSGFVNGAVTAEKMSSSGGAGVALVADGNGGAEWGQVGTVGIADGAVRADKIADGSLTASKFSDEDMGQYAGQALVSFEGALTGVGWGQVGSAGIADAAVTPEKTAGVVGAIPVGAADSTTYGSFWIE